VVDSGIAWFRFLWNRQFGSDRTGSLSQFSLSARIFRAEQAQLSLIFGRCGLSLDAPTEPVE